MISSNVQEIDIDSIHPVRFLQEHFPTWTLFRIAVEMDYSDSIVRQWSSGYRNAARRAKKKAVEVYLKYK